MRASSPGIVVVGSLNIDYIASVKNLPAPGETVAAGRMIRRFGGKGANQAIAAARQGARVTLVGSVGIDDEGRAYCKRLRTEGIDATLMSQTAEALTGTALIAVDSQGENTIIVAAGANEKLNSRAIQAVEPAIRRASALLLQFEIPMSTTCAVVRLANRARVPVVLNPSPLREGFPWGKCHLDTLIVNAGEAHAIFGMSAEGIADHLLPWRKSLFDCKVENLIITRGARSTLCLTAKEWFEVPTLKVTPVDTVGAGDAFTGTLISRRAEGLDLFSAIQFANCAGALTTLKSGAQEAIPNRAVTTKAVRSLRPPERLGRKAL